MTFLFTDVEGSTSLLSRLGEGYRPLLDEHERIIRQALSAHGGVEVKTEGDSFFAAFGDAGRAISAALDAQLALVRQPWPDGCEIRVRMGLHTGEAHPVNGDYIAIAVNLAARVSAAAHGGQVVATDATARAAGALPPGSELRPSGRFRFKGFDEPVAVAELRHPDLLPVETALRALPAAAHSFRPERTSFLGRESELDTLRSLLRSGPLLTLTGAGGAGKTRLARELAVQIASDFPDGAWFVDLSPLPTGDDIAETVARGLGIREDPQRPLRDVLTEELESRRLLVVLDNCEHVLDAASVLADDLLATCPGVSVMATSRERLGVPGEIVWIVPPLTPGDSVELFEDRAATARPGFRLEPEDRDLALAICRRLDGLPLAVELAAVRVGSGMTLAQILERLERRFYLLEGGARTSMPRHKTLRAMIEWSYELLGEREQTALRRMAVFAGSFSLEGAEAVCHGDMLPRGDVPARLGALVDKSLVVIEDNRYRLLESIREYALLRLASAGEEEAFARHLRWATSVAHRRADEHDDAAYYDRLAGEYDEIRAAIERSLTSDAAREGLALCVTVGRFLSERSHLADCKRWVTELLARLPDLEGRERAAALARLGGVAERQGEEPVALQRFAEAIAFAESAADDGLLIECLIGLGSVHVQRGDPGKAEAHWLRAEAVARRPGSERWLWPMRNNLAYMYFEMGQLDAAREMYERMRAEAGDGAAEAGFVHTGLFDIALAEGDVAGFQREIGPALTIHEQRGNLSEVAYAVQAVAVMARHDPQAARLLGAARAILERTGVVSSATMDAREERASGLLRTALGVEAFAAAWDEGVALDVGDAASEARAVAERLSPASP